MCVVVVKESGQILSDQIVDKCWQRNGKGGGFVFIPKNGDVVTEKGIMTLDALKSKTKDYRGEQGVLITHFRIPSKGGDSPELTHPFSFGDGRYLFHNGTVRILETSSTQSDSQFLANLLTDLSDEDALAVLERIIKKVDRNRFVAVIGKKYHLFGDKESVYKDGLWFSNTAHETHDPRTTVYHGDGDWTPAERQTYTVAAKETLSTREKEQIIELAVAKLCRVNNVKKENLVDYSEQIIKDFKLRDLPENELIKIRSFFPEENPLLEYFKKIIL